LEERSFAIDEDQFNDRLTLRFRNPAIAGHEKPAQKPKPTCHAEVVARVGRSEFKGYVTTQVDDSRVTA
jgi:hypothetical protein